MRKWESKYVVPTQRPNIRKNKKKLYGFDRKTNLSQPNSTYIYLKNRIKRNVVTERALCGL